MAGELLIYLKKNCLNKQHENIVICEMKVYHISI